MGSNLCPIRVNGKLKVGERRNARSKRRSSFCAGGSPLAPVRRSLMNLSHWCGPLRGEIIQSRRRRLSTATNTRERVGPGHLPITSSTVPYPPANDRAGRCHRRTRYHCCARSRGGRSGIFLIQPTRCGVWSGTSAWKTCGSRIRLTMICPAAEEHQ